MTTETAPKLREYQGLWLQIAKSSKVISVRCHKDFARRLKQAVRKEKALANSTRKNLDMPRYGELQSPHVTCKRDANYVIISFSLLYNGDQL